MALTGQRLGLKVKTPAKESESHIGVPDPTPNSSFWPVQTVGGSGGDSSNWVCATHVGDRHWAPGTLGSRRPGLPAHLTPGTLLQPSATWAVVHTCGES